MSFKAPQSINWKANHWLLHDPNPNSGASLSGLGYLCGSLPWYYWAKFELRRVQQLGTVMHYLSKTWMFCSVHYSTLWHSLLTGNLLHCTFDHFGQKLLLNVTPANNPFTRTEPEDINAQLPLTSFQLSVIKPPGGKSQNKAGKCNHFKDYDFLIIKYLFLNIV